MADIVNGVTDPFLMYDPYQSQMLRVRAETLLHKLSTKIALLNAHLYDANFEFSSLRTLRRTASQIEALERLRDALAYVRYTLNSSPP